MPTTGWRSADVEVRIGSAAEPTECCIKGPHTFLGYIDAGDDSHAFDGEWFRTGDVAELVDGRVRIIGRIKDIVIRNGLKIPAAEVEEAVSRIGGVRDCAAYSVADDTTGERLAMAVVLEPDTELSLAEVAQALVAEGLPKYKLPEELVFWDEPLPVNANGKVDRTKLARAVGRSPAAARRASRHHGVSAPSAGSRMEYRDDKSIVVIAERDHQFQVGSQVFDTAVLHDRHQPRSLLEVHHRQYVRGARAEGRDILVNDAPRVEARATGGRCQLDLLPPAVRAERPGVQRHLAAGPAGVDHQLAVLHGRPPGLAIGVDRGPIRSRH